jgi:hypothetical protein
MSPVNAGGLAIPRQETHVSSILGPRSSWGTAMAIRIDISIENRLVYVHYAGLVDDELLLGADDDLRANADFQPHFDQIADLSSAHGQDVTRQGIQSLVNRPPLFGKESRRAIVVSNELGFGLVRMFELMRDSSAGEIRVFKDIDEAYAWLGRVAPPDPTPS